jgi:protein TonB
MLLRTTAASYESGLQRSPGAFGASLLSHAAIVWLLYALMTLPGTSSSSLTTDTAPLIQGLVWRAGPAGGGGGGGDHSPTPPRRLETVGADAMAMPIRKAPPLTPPHELPNDTTPPPMALVLTVNPMDAGQLLQAGVIQNASLAPNASQGPGTDNGAGKGRRGGSGDGNGLGVGDGQDLGIGNNAFRPGGEVSSPILLREVRPAYTPDAMRAHIQGEVLLTGIVLPDGSVTRLRVLRSLDPSFGLDEQAIHAVQQWRFKPGIRLGQPVAVQIDISVGFTMR